MNLWIGWALAALAIAVGYMSYGWQGAVLGITVVVFWMLLGFSRAMRTMRIAGQAPVGRVESAVMLQAKLRKGMRLIDVVKLTRSLGQRVSETPEVWAWKDEGGAAVELSFDGARLASWRLSRPGSSD